MITPSPLSKVKLAANFFNKKRYSFKAERRTIKLILSHERHTDLAALLECYKHTYAELGGYLKKPYKILILDSSCKIADSTILALSSELRAEYIHLPSANISEKINHFIHFYWQKWVVNERLSYIDLCTDQDPTFYGQEKNSLKTRLDAPGIENCSTLGWRQLGDQFNDKRLNNNQPKILLRSQGSRETLTECESVGSSFEAVLTRCMLPNPNQFWACLRADVFKERSLLMSTLTRILSIGQEKLIECYLNIFHAFLSQNSQADSLKIRACDDRASLRVTQANMSTFKRSFASLYQELKTDPKAHHQCIEAVKRSIFELSKMQVTVFPKRIFLKLDLEPLLTTDYLIRLLTLTITSYSKAIEYDLHFEMYVYASYRESYKSAGWYVERIQPQGGHPGIYAFWRNSPLLITPKTEAKIMKIVSPTLVLANRFNLDIIKSIPKTYWTQVQKIDRHQ